MRIRALGGGRSPRPLLFDERARAPCCSTTTRRSARPTATARSSAATRTARAACACPRASAPRAASTARRSSRRTSSNQCSTAQCLSFDNCTRLGPLRRRERSRRRARPAARARGGDSSTTARRRRPTRRAALPSCVDPTQRPRRRSSYMTGSSNFPPLLAKLAPLILATGYTPVYQVTSSCTGVARSSARAARRCITDPAPGPERQVRGVLRAGRHARTPCSLGPGGAPGRRRRVGHLLDDVRPATAPGGGVGEYLGPIQAMAFVVPGKSQRDGHHAPRRRAPSSAWAATGRDARGPTRRSTSCATRTPARSR